MSDCTNVEIRDLLPDLARGTLTGASRVDVEDHLATCASCRAELTLLRHAHAALAAAPSVNTSRIAAAVVGARASQRSTTRRVWLAAASVAAIVGGTLVATSVVRTSSDPDVPPVVVEFEPEPAPPALHPDEPRATPRATPRGPVRAELVVGGSVSELADADLESLLTVLDGLDAQLDVEPAPVLPLLEGEV